MMLMMIVVMMTELGRAPLRDEQNAIPVCDRHASQRPPSNRITSPVT